MPHECSSIEKRVEFGVDGSHDVGDFVRIFKSAETLVKTYWSKSFWLKERCGTLNLPYGLQVGENLVLFQDFIIKSQLRRVLVQHVPPLEQLVDPKGLELIRRLLNYYGDGGLHS
jgi:hypothetical protein